MRYAFTHLRLPFFFVSVIVAYFFFAPHLYTDLYRWLTPWQSLLVTLPYLLSLIILLISWNFHNTKPFWVATIICLVHASAQSELYYQGVFTLSMLVLLPLWMLLLAILPPRPLLSREAIGQFVLLALPLMACAAAFYVKPGYFLDWLTYEPLVSIDWLNSSYASQFTPKLPYTTWIISLQVLATISMLVMLFRYRQQQDFYLLATFALLSWSLFGPIKPLELILLFNFLLIIWLLAVLIYGHNLAYLDELTGLPGRRALNQKMKSMSKKSVVAMLDVDHFKRFNDTYGHDVGDQVLKMVASKMSNVRGGTAYRYGGEEFTILFPNTPLETANAAAEEVRIAIEQSTLQLRSKYRPKSPKKGSKLRGSGPDKDTRAVSVTVSIGLAENTMPNPLKEADKKLYQAKESGRNQVCS